MDPGAILWRNEEERRRLLVQVATAIEDYRRDVSGTRTMPIPGQMDPRALAESFDFSSPIEPCDAIERALVGLRALQVHPAHRGYFGLFNPATTAMGVAADALVAAFNPQLATHSHSPFAVEVELHLVRSFAAKFGFEPEQADGTFCSGGAEANHTAILTALNRAFPTLASTGLRGLSAQPSMYVTTEAHDSLAKAARLTGLGTDAVRLVPVDSALRMDVAALSARVREDRARGLSPFLVVATAGTTSAGAIDPIGAVAEVAAREGLWLHVDAAWGGAAALVPELRGALAGIESADSITLDAHKWLSVPMGAGLFLTRHTAVLGETFRIDTEYMPDPKDGQPDPYARSIQWSRRFIGLKVLLSLAVAGWEGYAAVLRHQVAMGNVLRRLLGESGFRVVNTTPLPLVCFVDERRSDGQSAKYLSKAMHVVTSEGKSWISMTRIGEGKLPALRACITNYETTEEDLARLIVMLERARLEIA